MNANQMINMAVRMIMRKLMNKGINAGIDKFSQRGGAPNPQGARQAKDMVKRARQAARFMRRF
ncbi:hypothetical protein [Donghicola tyrosinivorans]|uniref:Uncharacterized protein n=1 Tax=Donghicola tyrosinivorans TaxID=1652492 RepID=A0A2T0X5R1_9RHOB|nr:hypothetical protein [Donghicola tyrosinivorans]PRY94269.1 hypothetical protein CLV74_101405 [Donghicola tyrosinivorans]